MLGVEFGLPRVFPVNVDTYTIDQFRILREPMGKEEKITVCACVSNHFFDILSEKLDIPIGSRCFGKPFCISPTSDGDHNCRARNEFGADLFDCSKKRPFGRTRYVEKGRAHECHNNVCNVLYHTGLWNNIMLPGNTVLKSSRGRRGRNTITDPVRYMMHLWASATWSLKASTGMNHSRIMECNIACHCLLCFYLIKGG